MAKRPSDLSALKNNRWLQLLKQHYTAPLNVAFKQFKLGAMVFFLGMVMVYMSQQLLPPSPQQELFLLVAIVLVAIGFIIAMMAQVRLLISRLLRFFMD